MSVNDPSTPASQTTTITPYLSIGSLYSSYDPFDVIVNLAYRYDGDGFKRHQVTTSFTKGKTIINVGIHDLPSEPLDTILPILLPILRIHHKYDSRILVHCQAGRSRSGAVAIAFLAEVENLSYEDALAMIQAKRPIVLPNEGFSRMVNIFLKNNGIPK